MNGLGWLLLASVGLSWLVASMVFRRAEHWKLVQVPNHRSSHVLPTPNGSTGRDAEVSNAIVFSEGPLRIRVLGIYIKSRG
jgi:hypothetical protein